ncbi:UDP-N-acetylmuramate dehydrogenase [Flavobacterium arcticum]|uniref:UDP-N-acetylenolpyruvoylglucosamine reductase n=1 Tax=Flavobacterium arcticum TaxID=1784713 RepID=A0A345H996_9FLAO|nr:UDP-N-acetylmuramate dehydrogenase [Flavobacterium arcticum]AXG73156.1 UDP-N-acetylmuramate dehydrogenase [Flavobacterium arcticum]KAF2512948.1 UDP-N-acetylmuramate dehydrogenase [Flavobacterium arcticum]
MKIENNFDLTNYNSYKIKAACNRAFFPANEADFIEIFKNSGLDNKVIIGGGYNIIFSKDHYEEDFIMLGENYSSITLEPDNVVVCEAGVSTIVLTEFALTNSLSGVEIFYDIPSSLGGAVVMNAGASGEEIKDILVKVRYLDLTDMKVKEINKEDIGYEYRNSLFQRETNKVVLKVWLQLHPKNADEIKDKMETVKEARWAKQPKEHPNAGSVFKRPPGHYVGPMIDELKLKGFRIGGAEVSKKHGGFIVNVDNATGMDIINVIKHVQAMVKERFGVDLEIEQRII